MTQEEVYNVARKSWRISSGKLSTLKYVFAVSNSKIVGMFECYDWNEVKDETDLEYNGENIGRKYFEGSLVKEEILKKYLSSDISFITKGQQTPTLYLKENILRKYKEWLENKYVTRKNTKLDKITVDASIYRLNRNIERMLENKLIEDKIFFFLLDSNNLLELKQKLEEKVGKLKDYSFAFNSFIAFKKFIETGENLIEILDQNDIELKSGEDKMEYQRIIYGAPGTGKSCMLKKESEKIFEDIIIEQTIIDSDGNDNTSDRQYWLVGAFWGNDNKLDEFIKNGYWQNGWEDKFLNKVKEIKSGDYIGIKTLNRHTNETVVRALGIVTKNYNDGSKIDVNWLIKEEKAYSNRRYSATIHKITGARIDMFTPLVDLEKNNGKKIKVIKEILNPIERVTFYDGYTYGQFVGTYKPVPSDIDSENIVYKYIPGPLMTTLVKALQNPGHKFLLIIEEINRAKADRVFGNIFQLLDRDKDGKSEYPIAISTEVEKYLKEQFEDDSQYQEYFGKGLILPNNLYIWATMNNADQGVYPLDTAFKRRWSFEYVGLDDNAEKFGEAGKEYCVHLKFENDNDIKKVFKHIPWNKFREKLNEFLLENGINEDRLIAPFFINSKQFSEDVDKNETTTLWVNEAPYLNKLLMYIFDDVLKHKIGVRKRLFTEDILSFSQLIKKYKTGECIYSEEFLDKLNIKEQA